MSRLGPVLASGALAAVVLVSGAAANGPAVRATATLAPRAVLFGDVVTARLDATVDPQRIDPRSLRLRADFRPYLSAGPAMESVREADGRAYVRLTLRLRCWTTACLAGAKRHRLVLDRKSVV